METEKKIEQPEVNAQLKKLWDAGIPVKSATFQADVDDHMGTPNIKYDLKSGDRGRRVDMVWTPHGLLCRSGKDYWGVPTANLRFYKFK
jgi:hypothetical protein